MISSADDLEPPPDPRLVRLLTHAAARAEHLDLGELERRSIGRYLTYVQTWPGEHYRLLPALAQAWEATHAVEIGTYRGHGTLALLAGLPAHGTITTYDVVPWNELGGSVLVEADFGERLEQRLGDLTDAGFLERELETLRRADLLFLDGPKDGSFERALARTVLPQLADRERLLVVDDIRVLNMVQLWRELPYPKLDATSFGHWSGTGLVLLG